MCNPRIKIGEHSVDVLTEATGASGVSIYRSHIDLLHNVAEQVSVWLCYERSGLDTKVKQSSNITSVLAIGKSHFSEIQLVGDGRTDEWTHPLSERLECI